MLKASVLNRTVRYLPVHLLLGFNQLVLVGIRIAQLMESSMDISTPGCTRDLDARVLICMSILSHATSAAVLVLFNTCFECYWARRLSSVKSDMFHLSKKTTTTTSLQRDKKTART